MNLKSAANFRRTLTGIALILGPLLILIGEIIIPEGSDEVRDYLQNTKDDLGAAEWGTTVSIFGFAITALGIVGLVSQIRARGVVLANLALVLAGLGMILFLPLWATGYFDVALVENLSLEQATEVVESAEDDIAGFYPVLAVALLGTLIGFILLGVAIIRSGVAPKWAGVLIILGILGVAASDGSSKVIAIVADVLLLVGFGAAGMSVLRRSDSEWESGVGAPATGTPPTSSEPHTPLR